MKRGFAVIGFSFLSGMLISKILGTVPSLIFAAALFLCVIALAFLKQLKERRAWFSAVLFMFMGITVFTCHNLFNVLPTDCLIDEDGQITGVVLDAPKYENGKYYYKLRVESCDIENAPKSFKTILTSASQYGVGVNDTISVKAHFSSSYSSNYANGYYVTAFAGGSITVTEKGHKNLRSFIASLREHTKESLYDILGSREGGVVAAMVLGNKSGIDSDLKRAFSESGVYHLFAVSGLHVSLLSMFVYTVLKKLRAPRVVPPLFGIAFTLFYMALTGLSMSVLRAGIMVVLTFLSFLFSKRTDSLNSLGFAAFIICLFNPTAVYSVSFLLTVSASMGLITLGLNFCRKYSGTFVNIKFGSVLTSVMNSVFVSVSILIFCLPVFALYFKEVSIVSVIANIIFIPVGTFTIVCGGLAAVLSAVPALGMLTGLGAGLGAKIMIYLADGLSELPFTTLGLGEKYISLWIAGSMLIFALAFVIKKDFSLLRFTAAASAAVLIVASVCFHAVNSDVVSFYIYGGGKQVSVLMTNGNKGAIFGCHSNSAANCFDDICTHFNISEPEFLALGDYSGANAGGVSQLMRIRDVQTLVAPREDGEISAKFENVIPCSNITIDLWHKVSVKCIYEKDYAAFYIQYGESSVVILPDSKNKSVSDSRLPMTPSAVICAVGQRIVHGAVNISCNGAVMIDCNGAEISKNEYTVLEADDNNNLSFRSEYIWAQ